MKNKLAKLMLVVAIIATTGVKAQSFKKDQVDFNAGIGFGTTFIGYTSTLPALSISGEYGVTDAISVGGYLGFTGERYTYYGYDYCPAYGNGFYYTATERWTFIIIGARGAYHFAQFINVDNLDVYAGLMLGYNIAGTSFSTNDPCPNDIRYTGTAYGGLAWSLYAGARYRFTDHLGVFAELGYGIDYLTIGLNYKL